MAGGCNISLINMSIVELLLLVEMRRCEHESQGCDARLAVLEPYCCEYLDYNMCIMRHIVAQSDDMSLPNYQIMDEFILLHSDTGKNSMIIYIGW